MTPIVVASWALAVIAWAFAIGAVIMAAYIAKLAWKVEL